MAGNPAYTAVLLGAGLRILSVAPADLGGEGIRLVLAQPEVPAGRYARESVCAMADDPAVYGEEWQRRIKGAALKLLPGGHMMLHESSAAAATAAEFLS